MWKSETCRARGAKGEVNLERSDRAMGDRLGDVGDVDAVFAVLVIFGEPLAGHAACNLRGVERQVLRAT